jgi:hypothetical protein
VEFPLQIKVLEDTVMVGDVMIVTVTKAEFVHVPVAPVTV